MEFLVVGGQQKQAFSLPQEEFTRFGNAVVARYTDKGEGVLAFEYVTPPEARPDGKEASVLFKSSSISGDKLHLCTQTELLTCRLTDFELLNRISLPMFNDVHHVVESKNGTLLVAVTGLDMVVRLAPDGTVLEQWNTLGRDPWAKWSQNEDYRKWLTTKPHASHPNFVFEYGDEVWVSRFEQKDAICLNAPERRINIGQERPHDGHISGDRVYFTTVDGHVVIADLISAEVLDVIDLHACDPDSSHTGWSRGLKIIDEDHVLVGFSTLRVTKFRENVRWMKHRFGMIEQPKPTPTHVALYNLTQRRLVWRHMLDSPQVDVIFSIL